MAKICEKCGKKIPDDYVNLLCDECYATVASAPATPNDVEKVTAAEPEKPKTDPSKFGITDPNYTENPEMDDKEQVLANLAQFTYSHDPAHNRPGKLLWYPQRNMYNFLRNFCMTKSLNHPQSPKNGGKHVWKPSVVDVGCGSGVGANVISQEADFVWAIDKNKMSIEFCHEAFNRTKNSIYYTPQLTCEVFDIMTDTRETMKFDVVVAIEVIEHIYDTNNFLRNVIKKFGRVDKRGNVLRTYDATDYFFSSPNRAFHKLRKDRPENPFHVREWTKTELKNYLSNYFEVVEMLNTKGEPIPEENEDKDQVIMAHCKYPRI